MSTDPARGRETGAAARVYMLARKPLRQNARVFKQAGSLAAAGYAVTVFGLGASGPSASERLNGFTLVRVEDRGLRWWPMLSRWLGFYLGVYRRMRGTPAEIIHCNDLDTLPLGLLLARGAGARVVYDVQDLYPDEDHIPRWLTPLLRMVERLAIRRVDRTIAVNDAIAETLLTRYRARVDTVVLNCAPFAEVTEGSTPSVRDVLQVPANESIVVYSGGLAPHRGLENTLLALRELEQTRLVFLGEGPLRERLRQLADSHGLGPRVAFLDFVSHLQVPHFIHSADMGIVPYEHRGLNHYLCSPSKLFHYVMAELPVVCSDFPFLRQIVLGNGIGTVFDPADPSSIAAAIRGVAVGREESAERRARLQTLKHRYCWEEEEERFLALYRSLPARERLD